MLEFALAGSFIFLPLLAGVSTIGFQIVLAQQVASLTHTAGRIMATGNIPTTVQLSGSGLDLSSGGNGEVIVSTIQNVDGSTVSCTQQTILGNSSLPAGKIAPGGVVDSTFATKMQSAALANQGQVIYVAEVYYQTPTLIWSGLLPGTGGPIYNRAIF